MVYRNKRIWGSSFTAFVSWFFVLLPYIVLIGLVIIDGPHMFWDFPIFMAISYIFYFGIGIGGIGYISIGSQIHCARDWTPSFRYIQGVINFSIDDIVGIEFTRADGNSDGLKQYRMWNYSYLVFLLKDNNTKMLYLFRFSTKQYIQIQQALLQRNPEILVLTSAEDFIKKYGR